MLESHSVADRARDAREGLLGVRDPPEREERLARGGTPKTVKA